MSFAINIPSKSSSSHHNPRNSSSSFSSSYTHSSSPRFASPGTTPSSVHSFRSCRCGDCDDSTPSPPSSLPASTLTNAFHRHQKQIPIVNMNPTPHTRNVIVHHHHRNDQHHRTSSQPPISYHNSSKSQPVVIHGTSERRHRSRSRGGHSARARSSSTGGGVSVYVHGSDATTTYPAPGTTQFPRNQVSKSAVRQLNYPYTIDDDVQDGGVLTVLLALGQKQIDELIQLSKDIRSLRRLNKSNVHVKDNQIKVHQSDNTHSHLHPNPHHHHNHNHHHRHHDRDQEQDRSRRRSRSSSKKAVAFYSKTIVHDMPLAPSPPPPSGGEQIADNNHDYNRTKEPVLLVPAAPSSTARSDRTAYRHQYHLEPLSPPGPSTPKVVMDSLNKTRAEFPLGSAAVRERNHHGHSDRRSSRSRSREYRR